MPGDEDGFHEKLKGWSGETLKLKTKMEVMSETFNRESATRREKVRFGEGAKTSTRGRVRSPEFRGWRSTLHVRVSVFSVSAFPILLPNIFAAHFVG
jgi:hypothetical protein